MTLTEVFRALADGRRVRFVGWPERGWIGIVDGKIVNELGDQVLVIPVTDKAAHNYEAYVEPWLEVGDKVVRPGGIIRWDVIYVDGEAALGTRTNSSGMLTAYGFTRLELENSVKHSGWRIEKGANSPKESV